MHMKRCSTAPPSRQMQIRNTETHHTYLGRITFQPSYAIKAWQATGTNVLWEECEMVQPLWRIFGHFLWKHTYNSEIKFRCISPIKIKRHVQINTFTQMLIAVLFIKAKSGNPNFYQQAMNKGLSVQQNTTQQRDTQTHNYLVESLQHAKAK